MPLTPSQIIEAVSGYSDPGKGGIAAVAMMEASGDYSGPYSDTTRDWMQRWLTDQCSYYRILTAAAYAAANPDTGGGYPPIPSGFAFRTWNNRPLSLNGTYPIYRTA